MTEKQGSLKTQIREWPRAAAEKLRTNLRRVFVSRRRLASGQKLLKNLSLAAALTLAAGTLISYVFIIVSDAWLRPAVRGAAGLAGMQQDFHFTAKQPNGDFAFTGFEKDKDLQAWHTAGARLSRSERYPSEGSSTLHLEFPDHSRFVTLLLDNLSASRQGGYDWSAFEAFHFTAFSPSKEPVQITLKITDFDGAQYSENLKFPGGVGVAFDIPLERAGRIINLKKVEAFSLLLHGLKQHREFYFDDFRLTRGRKTAFEAAAVTPETMGAANAGSTAGDVKPFDYGFIYRRHAWRVQEPGAEGEVIRIPLGLVNETGAFCRLCAVDGGVPFPMGELKSLDNIRLLNSRLEEMPLQPRMLARWPDGSIKWAGIHFEASMGPKDGTGFFLDYGPQVTRTLIEDSLELRDEGSKMIVETGPMQVVLDKSRFYLFDEVRIDENGDKKFDADEVVSSQALLRLGFRGEEYRTDLARKDYRLEVEESGPRRIVLKAAGWFGSEKGGRFSKVIVRYYFYAGKKSFKLAHTLVYTGYPANSVYEAYQGLKLPENEPVDSFGLRIPYMRRDTLARERLWLGQTLTNPLDVAGGASVRLLQTQWDRAGLTIDGAQTSAVAASAGWMSLQSGARGIALAVRHFSENYPKAFEWKRQESVLDLDLWPAESGPLDLQTTAEAVGPEALGRGSAFGLAKTHEIQIAFHQGDGREGAETSGSFAERLLVRTNPYWVDATGALGRLLPVDRSYVRQERVLERLFDWADRQPKMFGWYGMLHFGDTRIWWREETGSEGKTAYGWHPSGRWGWYNVEGPGTHTGALLQFARSGLWKYFEFGENLARHVMDVDTIHYNTIAEDPRLRGVLNDEFSRVGSMHRHNGQHWGGRSEEASHTNVWGILLYHYLTGDERARDVALEAGEFFLGEHFTYTGHPDIAPQRGLANALWGDVLLYELTGDKRYLSAARKLVNVLREGQKSDGSFLETYNPETGMWSGEKKDLYMAWYTVPALVKYHELTQDEKTREMLFAVLRYLAPREYSGPAVLNGLAYAYLISKDAEWIRLAELNLNRLVSASQVSRDPLADGQIFGKPIYHRPNIFLATAPYVFGALEDHFQSTRPKS